MPRDNRAELSTRVPPNLANRLSAAVIATGKAAAKILREALVQWLERNGF